MALISVPFMPQDGTIVIQDGSGAPISLTVQYEAGDLSIDGFQQDNKTVIPLYDRGTIFGLRKEQDEPVTFSFSAIATDISDGTEKTIIDAFNKTGAFASGMSMLGANADVWAVQLIWTGEQTDFGAGADSTITLDNCVAKVAFQEGAPAQFNISGTAYPINGSGISYA